MELVPCKQNTNKSQSSGGSEYDNFSEKVNLQRSELSKSEERNNEMTLEERLKD